MVDGRLPEGALYADEPGWLTVVRGTLTNTGTTTRDFAIELQATNGQVTTPALSAPWRRRGAARSHRDMGHDPRGKRHRPDPPRHQRFSTP